MLKLFVAAAIGICTVPCFAIAQQAESVITDQTIPAPVAVDAPLLPAVQAETTLTAEPVVINAPIESVSMPVESFPVGDCGCGCDAQPAVDCGCEAAPSPCAPRTRKKLALVDTQRERCRLKMTCTTDCCGCSKRKLTREKVTVNRKKLTLADAPARERCGSAGSRLRGLVSRLGSRGGCGCDAAPAAPACGCEAAPAPVAAPCGCGS